jgi:tetratricopeptide (TPR) repeat protein
VETGRRQRTCSTGRAHCCRPGDPRLPGLLVELGAALLERGELDEADGRFAEAVDAAQVLGNRGLELRAMLEGAFVRILVNPKAIDAFRELTDTMIPELESLGDEQTLAVAWRMVAHGYLLDVQGADMEQALRRSIEHARRAGDRRGELEALQWLLRLQWFGPAAVDDGIRLCEQTLAEADAEPGFASVATQILGLLYGLRGEFNRGRELLAQAGAIQIELGMELGRAAGSGMAGAVLEQLAGDYEAAEGVLRPSIEVLREAGEKGYYSTLLGYLAHISYAQGKYDEAEEQAREADEAGGPDDVETQRFALAVRGMVLARRGETAEAERLARAAVELLAPTDSLVAQAEVMLDLAEVLALAGRSDEASAAAREAAQIYAAKGAGAGVRLAEARVAELEA